MRVLVAVVLLALLFGCAQQSGTASSPSCAPTDSTSKTASPALLVASPALVKPGQRFVVTFPTKRVRGANLFLDRVDTGECGPSWLLSSDEVGQHWLELPESGNFTTLDEPRPRRVVHAIVPPSAAPGTYRVCAEAERKCAVLAVTK